jgi:lipopolysaccharide/colanic/teichoic acid biosynthesis glycosyltransferase
VYLRNFFHDNFPLILDTLILNVVIFLSFFIRLEVKEGFYFQDYLHEPWIINLLSTIMFWGSAYYLGVYPHHRFSIQGIIKANILTFTLLASLTFFLKQFAYSRLVVIAAAFASPFFMILWRGILKRYYRGDKSAWGKDVFSKPTVIVGNGNGAVTLFQKIREMRDMSYDLLGVVTIDEDETIFKQNHIPVLGKIENLQQLISMHRVRQVIFSSEMLSYEKILKTMSEIGKPQLEYKIAPSNLEVVIGKSSIERLDDYPFLEIEYAIGKPFNRVTKRAFDIIVASFLLMIGAPLLLPVLFFQLRNKKNIHIVGAKSEPVSISQIKSLQSKNPANHWLLWWEVLRGKLSFVGAPLRENGEAARPGSYWYKPGLTGLVQINRKKIITPDDMEKYHLFYLKNQSILLDVEILLKSIFLKG